MERGTVRVKSLAHEHNAMSPARSRTRTARSGVERTNHEATDLLTCQTEFVCLTTALHYKFTCISNFLILSKERFKGKAYFPHRNHYWTFFNYHFWLFLFLILHMFFIITKIVLMFRDDPGFSGILYGYFVNSTLQVRLSKNTWCEQLDVPNKKYSWDQCQTENP